MAPYTPLPPVPSWQVKHVSRIVDAGSKSTPLAGARWTEWHMRHLFVVVE
jgi:hypothetical protein